MLNHIYRVIFNQATGCYVAVSEITKSSGKSSGRSGQIGSTPTVKAAKLYAPDLASLLRRSVLTLAIASVTGLGFMLNSQAVVCAAGAGNDNGRSDNTACGNGSMASGDYSTASGYASTASGSASTATGVYSIASGNVSTATGGASTATGDASTATGAYSTASGNASTATGVSSNASGDASTATGGASKALGRYSTTTGAASMASGAFTGALANNSVAMGGGDTIATATGQTTNSDYTNLTDANNILASGRDSFGRNYKTNKTTGNVIYEYTDYTYAPTATTGALSTADNAIAIGRGTHASINNGVAIGSESHTRVDAGVAGYDASTGAATTKTTSTWKATHAAVAVGDGTTVTRQITGVAAGATDTDAVNVAQLKSVVSGADKRILQRF